VAKESVSKVLSIGGQEVRITNPEKLYFFSQIKVTKLERVQYYLSIAPATLAGIQDLPVVLKRFVNGAESFAMLKATVMSEPSSSVPTATRNSLPRQSSGAAKC